jgi:hypothetical protein
VEDLRLGQRGGEPQSGIALLGEITLRQNHFGLRL